jgi:hypothetical protein
MSHKMMTEVRLPFALGSHERLFLGEGVKEGSAATKYCEQLSTLADSHKEEVTILMRFDRFNPYGWRLVSIVFILF